MLRENFLVKKRHNASFLRLLIGAVAECSFEEKILNFEEIFTKNFEVMWIH